MFQNWILLIGSLVRFLWRNKPQTHPSGSDGRYLFLRWFIYLSFWASSSPRRLNLKRDLHHACSNRLLRIKCDCLEMSKLRLEGLGIKIFWFSGNMTGITNDVPKSNRIEVPAVVCFGQTVRKFHDSFIFCYCYFTFKSILLYQAKYFSRFLTKTKLKTLPRIKYSVLVFKDYSL